MAPVFTPSYCAVCGGRLEPARSGLRGMRWRCSVCGMPVYEDPKLAVGAVVWLDGGVVLLRRAQHDEAHGRWILPGGHVNRGEVLTKAMISEVAEETGLEVRPQGLVGVYSYEGYPWVLVVYEAMAVGGRLNPGQEALELRIFEPHAIPWDELGYRSTAEALGDALRRRK